jgi:hypothetical protein
MRRSHYLVIWVFIITSGCIAYMIRKPQRIIHYVEIFFILGSFFYFLQFLWSMIQTYKMSKNKSKNMNNIDPDDKEL